jgi:hypothetical protein
MLRIGAFLLSLEVGLATMAIFTHAQAQDVQIEELTCPQIAPLLVKLWEQKGEPASFAIKYHLNDYPYTGYDKIFLKRDGDLLTLTLEGSDVPITDIGLDGIVDKVKTGWASEYDAAKGDTDDFSSAQDLYEKECEKLKSIFAPDRPVGKKK